MEDSIVTTVVEWDRVYPDWTESPYKYLRRCILAIPVLFVFSLWWSYVNVNIIKDIFTTIQIPGYAGFITVGIADARFTSRCGRNTYQWHYYPNQVYFPNQIRLCSPNDPFRNQNCVLVILTGVIHHKFSNLFIHAVFPCNEQPTIVWSIWFIYENWRKKILQAITLNTIQTI